jgi:hypothetical protein
MINVNEVYMTFDVDNDGFAEEIFMLIDDNDNPIIYDYVDNVFPDGKRPFHEVIINPIKGRWHGIGMMEIFWEMQKFIDLMLNRWEFSESKNGTVTFWHPELTKEGEANPSLRLNSGETYALKNIETPVDKVLQQVRLTEFKGENLKALLEIVNQMMVSLSATPSINDAALAGLDSTKLATGIRAIQRTAAEGFGPFLATLETGLQSAMEGLLALLLMYSDPMEKYHVLQDGKQTPMAIDTVNARTMEYAVNMEMTRYHSAQQVTEAESAEQVILRFYALPGPIQEIVAPFYVQVLHGYQVPNASQYIKPNDPMLAQFAPMLAGMVKGSLPAPSSQPGPPNPLTS